MSRTLKANVHDAGVVVAMRGRTYCLAKKRTEEEKLRRHLYGDNGAKYSQRLEPRYDGVTNTITTVTKDNLIIHMEKRLRIRKLTPKEVFRLMGVSDTNIKKIQDAGISNSQQYKMAGNSIVVDNLFHIFRKMFVDQGQECETNKQLSLF